MKIKILLAIITLAILSLMIMGNTNVDHGTFDIYTTVDKYTVNLDDLSITRESNESTVVFRHIAQLREYISDLTLNDAFRVANDSWMYILEHTGVTFKDEDRVILYATNPFTKEEIYMPYTNYDCDEQGCHYFFGE